MDSEKNIQDFETYLCAWKLLNKDELNRSYKKAIEIGATESVKFFLKLEGVDPCSKENTQAVTNACIKGHTGVVRAILLDHRCKPPLAWIMIASQHGHIEIVKALMNDERVDPSAGKNSSINLAKNALFDFETSKFLEDIPGMKEKGKNYEDIVSLLSKDKRVIEMENQIIKEKKMFEEVITKKKRKIGTNN